MSVEDLLHHIRKEASYDDDDDGEPCRTTGQQLHEYKVHVLGVEERPGGSGRDTMVTYVKYHRFHTLYQRWKVGLSESDSKILAKFVSELTEVKGFGLGP